MMQEIKTEDKNYPFDDLNKTGYKSYVFGQKAYNGVALLSKKELKNTSNDIFKDKLKQSRIITADLMYKKKGNKTHKYIYSKW